MLDAPIALNLDIALLMPASRIPQRVLNDICKSLPRSTYAIRRRKLLDALPENVLAVIPGNPVMYTAYPVL